MINSTSKTDPYLRPDPIGGKPSPTPAITSRSSDTDRLSAASQESLQAALRQQPEVRPEAVALGQKLVVDANYPTKEIIRQLSEMLLASADLSEQA
jgi:hypothetical protein